MTMPGMIWRVKYPRWSPLEVNPDNGARMNRFQLISIVFVLCLLSCKTVDCGSGTVEQDGKCVVYNKKEVDCGPGEIKEVLSNGTGTGRCIRPTLIKNDANVGEANNPADEAEATNVVEANKKEDAETKKQTIEEIQDVVDEKIASWQAEWTRATGTFGVSSAKGTVTDFEITDNMSIIASVNVKFQFSYGKRIITRLCSSSDFCSGDFREGQNKAKVVMTLDKVGYELVYGSHYVK
jgi:hypothetical protein